MRGQKVLGVGPLGAAVALVGEAPGMDEDRVGEPFVGAAGAMLEKMLQSAGLTKRRCYVTNVAKERPAGNDFRLRYYEDGKKGRVPKAELRKLQEELRAEIVRRDPCVVVALGEEALRALTGLEGIGKWRGMVHGVLGRKVVATYHPASVMRMYEQRAIVERDLRVAKDESKSREHRELDLELHVDPTFEESVEWLRRMRREGLGGKPVSFDIETLGATVRCIGLGNDARSALCLPFVSCRRPQASACSSGTIVRLGVDVPFSSHWEQEQEELLLGLLEDVLADPKVPLIAQNFPFDAAFMEREFGIPCRGLHMDTMIAQHACYCELPKGLDFLASFYTRLPYWSDYDARDDLQTWKYNCFDVVATWQVAQELEKELKELGV